LPARLELLRLMADAMPGLVSYIDAGFRYRYMNRTYREWFGIEPEFHIGDRPDEVTGPAAAAKLRPHFERALAGERVVYEVTSDFLHGPQRTVRGHLEPDRRPDGTVAGVFSFTLDITHERNTEQELRLAHRQAVEATRAKSQFIAAASHDLRQPLHAMALFITALARRVKDPEAVEIVEHLRVAVGSMRTMFAALLDVSKLDAGATIPAPADFALGELFAKLEPGFAAQAEANGIAFRVVPCRVRVHTDPALLETMLRNLLHNAVKFTRTGKVLLGCRRRDGALRIDVIDTGPGVAANHLDAIFDEFRRLQPGRKTGTEGLGLGLAIVRRLSGLLDLPVTVESMPERGSRFSIEVPLAAAAADSAGAARPADADATSLAGARILAVDDDEMVRGAVARILTDWGCVVATAGTPGAALAQVEREGFRPDLLLIDYNLGAAVDGIALTEMLLTRLPRRVPAILVTGSTDADAILRFESSGHTWLSKPVDSAQLRRTAAQLIARRRD
jgi:PAS domain S-box-containing protein